MEQRGLEISQHNANAALQAVAQRHAWWATGLRAVGFASVAIATIVFMSQRDDLMDYSRFFAVGFGSLFAARIRSKQARKAQQVLAAVDCGAVPRLHEGGIEVVVVGSLQRVTLTSAAAAKLTAQLVPPARARIT